uniref:Transketolase n=1 Tax=Nomascus leucogenys TaxID=61853 RepID=G1R6H9_NOMLE
MEGYHKPDQQKLQALKDTANRLRISSIQATTAAGSGHPTSCCSAAEIMAVLFFHTMRYKSQDPRNLHNDRFVLSKGHAAPILYAVWAEAGFLPEAELLNLRKISSDLDGHPVPKQAFTDVATGSLGQGLGAACGMAYTGKYFDKASYRVYCLLGDGELSEGSVWEAMAFASIYKLDNLVAILDINRLGQSDPAPLQHQMDIYQKRCEAFGWHAIIVDGHSVEELCKAFGQAKHQPTAIIAKTFKGRGITGQGADPRAWVGFPAKSRSRAKEDPGNPPQEDAPSVDIANIRMPSLPSYKVGDKVQSGARRRAIHLGQGGVSIAVGCATRNRTVPFCSTFAAFFTRAFDQIRMAAISESNINLCGSHCGVSIGEDGPSQMALEDLAMFRSVPTSTVFYPSDGVATEKAVELAANTKGICFIRTSRPENAIIYNNNEDFQVGQAKVVLKSKDDQVTVIGAGVTLHEALAAAELLKKEKINIRVLDPFTIKPLDRKLILDSARATKGRILTVEDHYYEGGIGEAVSSAVVGEPGITVTHLAVNRVPRSGKPAELLKMFGIDKDAIAQAVRGLITKA